MSAPVLLLAGLGVLVAVTLVARRIGAPVPVALVLVGIAVSFVPGLPPVELAPTVILEAVLPPILYAAAVQVRVIDLRRDWLAVAALAVVLVVISASASAALLLVAVPGIVPAAALAVGAVISPPDAVAATSIGRRLRLPPRLLTVLEGEGLLNDATALVLLGAALAVLEHGAVSPVQVGGRLVFTLVASSAIGLAAGAGSAALRVRLTDPVLDTAISIGIPFAASVGAVAAGGSGVLAVVVAGLYTGRAVRRRLSSAARTAWRINWSTIQFLLENGVFLLIGLELRSLLDDVGADAPGVPSTIALGLVLTAALGAVRFGWTAALAGVLHLLNRRPGASRGALLNRREAVVLGWAGMRGVVTLTAAQTLPTDLPHRPQLILVAFVVVATTLVLQGGTLAPLIGRLGVRGPAPQDQRAEFAELLAEVVRSGTGVLDDAAAILDEEVESAVIDRVRRDWQQETEAAEEAPAADGTSYRSTPQRAYRRLTAAVIDGARARLLEVRVGDRFSSDAVNRTQEVLDAAEQRLRAADDGR